MRDFCDILKTVLPPDNRMWTWSHINNVIDQMGEWRAGRDYHRLPLCLNCKLHLFAETDFETLCPRCNDPADTDATVNSVPVDIFQESILGD
jgi:hypothetical protein